MDNKEVSQLNGYFNKNGIQKESTLKTSGALMYKLKLIVHFKLNYS